MGDDVRAQRSMRGNDKRQWQGLNARRVDRPRSSKAREENGGGEDGEEMTSLVMLACQWVEREVEPLSQGEGE